MHLLMYVYRSSPLGSRNAVSSRLPASFEVTCYDLFCAPTLPLSSRTPTPPPLTNFALAAFCLIYQDQHRAASLARSFGIASKPQCSVWTYSPLVTSAPSPGLLRLQYRYR